jgi:hypothetical protein
MHFSGDLNNNDAKSIVIGILCEKRLKRNIHYSAQIWEDGLIVYAPTLHRPILKIFLSPFQKAIWDFFEHSETVGDSIKNLSSRFPGSDLWDGLCHHSDLERKEILVSADLICNFGIKWPKWKEM